MLLVAQRDHWGKRDAFLSATDSQYPHSMAGRLRVGSSTSWEPLSDSPLGYILRNWKILTLQKAWPQYKLGDPPQKKASEWHTSCCQKQAKDSEFPYVQSFMALSQNPGLSDSRLASFCCLPVSCPRLSLSIRFPRQPLLHLSYPHIYRKGF